VTAKRAALWAGVTAAVLGLSALVAWWSFPAIGRWYVRTRVIPKLEKRIGRDITVDKIVVTRGHFELLGLSVRGPLDAPDAPLVQVARIAADFDFWGALGGEVRLGPVTVEQPRAALLVHPDGRDNWRDVLLRVRGKPARGGAAPRRSRTTIASAQVTRGSARFEDQAHGLRSAIDDFGADWAPGGPVRLAITGASATTRLGPSAGVERVTITAQTKDLRGTTRLEVEGGRVALWAGFALSDVHGTIAPGSETDTRLLVNIKGGYAGAEGTLWRAEGGLDLVKREGEVKLLFDQFSLDKIASVLEGSMVMEPAKTTVGAALDLKLNGEVLSYDGHVDIAGLSVYHPWLAQKPLKDLTVTGAVRGRYATDARVFELDTAAVTYRGIEARLEGYAAFAGGHEGDGALRPKRRLRARLIVPPVPCSKALAALPRELTPKLQGFRLAGKFDTDLTVDIDWQNLEALELTGSVGIDGCRVLKPRDDMDAEKLNEEFEHVVEVEKDKYKKFIIGPSNPDFIPLADVSPYLVKSLLTTEDYAFYKHHGFIVSEFRTALVKNLQAGYFRVGASSITMQFVKNVMLHRQKTLARKLQELFLTWYVEKVLEKDRILEIYVNAIEFGPGLYGIGPAATHYFGKHPRDLNPVEAAFFSSILPNPKKRHMQYCDNKLFKWAEAKIGRIVTLMHDREHITDNEYALAQVTPLTFVYPEGFDQKECVKVTQRALKNARPTTPRPDEEDVPEDER
jgi:hypothetical protein